MTSTLDVSDYRRTGYQILRSQLEDDDVADAVSRFDELDRVEVPDSYQPEFDGDGPTRRLRKLRRLLWNDPSRWGPVLNRAGAPEVARSLLGDGAAVVFHAAFLKPARIGTPVALHQDQALWSHHYPGAFSFWVALTEVSPRNGGLFGCPGSHLGGTRTHRDRPEYPWHASLDAGEDGLGQPVDFDLTPGDTVVWDRNFAHGSASNGSPLDRRGMVVVFADGAAPQFAARDHFTLADLVALGTH